MWQQILKKDMSYCVCSGPNKTKGFTCKAHCRSKQIKKAPRIPRKKGQPANSKKHSDLYTDENPKGTIKGLGFKDVETAKRSVAKIKRSNRSHAHKTQAAIAMEQRAREMGKTSEANIYRTFINAQKKKTKAKKKLKRSRGRGFTR